MVVEPLWDKYGCGNGVLCIGCLEIRLSRRLSKTDFNGCRLNQQQFPKYRSERLKRRLGHGV